MAKGLDVLDFLRRVSRNLASSQPLPRILRAICRDLVQTIGGTTSSVMLLEDRNHDLAFSESFGLPKGEVATIRFRLGEGIAGRVAKTGKPILLADATRDRRFKRVTGQKTRIRSLLCVPINVRDSVLGVVSLTAPRPRAFDAAHVTLTEFLARQIALEIENHRLFELAVTDPLTGLYNRRHFERRLEEEVHQAARFHHDIAACMLDLDGFRAINSQYGHAGGDRALIHAARIVRGDLRSYDVAGRLGGDEFAFFLSRATREVAMRIAERVRRSIAGSPCGAIRVTASIGVAVFPSDARTPEALLAAADKALYAAKNAGRNRVHTTVRRRR